MKWLHFTVTKLTICIIVGILIAYYISIPWNVSCLIFGSFFSVLCIFFWIANKRFIQTIHFGIFAFLTTISLGIVIENFHEEKNHSTHISHVETVRNTQFRITEVLKSSSYYQRYIAEIVHINNKTASGKVLVYIPKDSIHKPLSVDAICHTAISPKEIMPALNPTSFDYKSYLNDRYIYHQLHLKANEFIVATSYPKTMYGYAALLREKIHNRLQAYNFKNDVLAVIEALLLGQRQYISKELQANYANAGAIHILAISGLHVGILVFLLQFVLRPLDRIKYGKTVKLLLMLSVLWSFAFISGLSASVVRAVTMFTAIVIATHFKRETNTLQVLTVSMFFLLLFKPHFLFDVGFQLSYAAVFAIISIQPLWKKLWNPRSFFMKSFWSLLTVSFSAQLGVLPLSLYYFHQFPSLFFVANLTIIPVLGIILALGILVMILAYFQCLPEFLALFYSYVIQQMNAFIAWIASFDSFVLEQIPMRFLQLIGCYLLLISCVQYAYLPKRKQLKIALFSILICQGLWFIDRFQQQNTKDAFIIFHQNKASILGVQRTSSFQLFHNLDSIALAKNYLINDQYKQSFHKSISFDSLDNIYSINDTYFLRIDSVGIYKIPDLKPVYVLLSYSPKINFNRMIKELQPNYIIADGSNYKTYVKRWEKAAKKQKIPFHYTGEKGFFSISLQD